VSPMTLAGSGHMRERQPPIANIAESEPQRKGWSIVVVFLALHAVIGVKLSTLGPRREATIGDPMSLWGGLFFVLWGAACLAARRAEDRSILAIDVALFARPDR
jgi:hypothetical protein